MFSCTMQSVYSYERPMNTVRISPGLVGSVGDVLASVRLKQSTPALPMRFDPAYEPMYGSNVQDGFSYSFTSGGGPAATEQQVRRFHPPERSVVGTRYQDMRAPDKTLEPIMGSTGRYDWYNRVANVYQAKVTGDMFLPLPGPFEPRSVTRGGQVPRIVAIDRPQGQNLNDDKFYDKREDKTKGNAPGAKRAIICTRPNGTRTYKLVPVPART